ncbi:16S rRNA (guanine(527)-N(7))-methyltransferase RsmG [Tropicimonas isoalkanivorans]|uniref:16S rRNA (guanine(527)-N(7))-methyltransferase RsmG n=1 Tax=Tropicimonas isoalkanivorans TaxID=441112 RepID=UPI000B8971EA|nr:16S rRNA (guanine(527)-N(7))-methyltransferase RsmG [Tropicimonas isoalkanivorans]
MLDALGLDVSRETLTRLTVHRDLLAKWNPSINLVAPSTLEASWTRHIVDSAQVYSMTTVSQGQWLDFGTGGGFPGLVCAILAAEHAPGLRFTFVESDKRKCAFLTTVVRETGIAAAIVSQRIETIPRQNANVISARAVAPLWKLLDYALPHLAKGGLCLFPKGERYREEIDAARASFHFQLNDRPSITDPKAVILSLGEIERV